MTPFTVAVPGGDDDRPRCSKPFGARSCRRLDAVVCGPGPVDERRTPGKLLEQLFAASAATVPTVLDADALNLLAPLDRSLPGPGPIIITPHPGEAGRLLGSDSRSVQADREAAVLELSARAGAVAVLKGAGTLVSDGERLYQNQSGNPGLATGGSGDVLTGLMAALLAQGMAVFDAACFAVHVHGAAGDRVAARLSEAGLCAEDLPEAIAAELQS